AARRALQGPELHRRHAGVLELVRRRRRSRELDGLGNAELREGTAVPGRPRRPRGGAGPVPERSRRGSRMSVLGREAFERIAGAALELPGADGVEVLLIHEWG